MEQQKVQINLNAAEIFVLDRQEYRELYVRMAMMQYRYLRVPNYCEVTLLKQLSGDMKKMLVEVQSLNEQFPNNHNLQRVRAYFDMHYKQLVLLQSSVSCATI